MRFRRISGTDAIRFRSYQAALDSRSREIRDNYSRLIHMARKSIYIQTWHFMARMMILRMPR